jgi:hypothetical protein
MNATDFLQHKADIWIEQMIGIAKLFDKLGEPTPDLKSYKDKVRQLYCEELEFAKLMDCSDLVIQASGIAIRQQNNGLSTVVSLFSNIEKQIKRMGHSVLQLNIADEKQILKSLDIGLTGLSSTGLYAGFSITPPTPYKLLGTDEQNTMMQGIKDATLSVTNVPECIQQGHISEAMAEYVNNPAVRDSAILAAYHLSPTGRGGINSLNLINPALNTNRVSTLNASHRQLLREITEQNPLIKSRSQKGSFIGNLTKVDLDSNRLDLRNIAGDGFSCIRCVMPALTIEKGRKALGSTVKLSGFYETTPTGKPSLMQVEQLEIIEQMTML